MLITRLCKNPACKWGKIFSVEEDSPLQYCRISCQVQAARARRVAREQPRLATRVDLSRPTRAFEFVYLAMPTREVLDVMVSKLHEKEIPVGQNVYLNAKVLPLDWSPSFSDVVLGPSIEFFQSPTTPKYLEAKLYHKDSVAVQQAEIERLKNL